MLPMWSGSKEEGSGHLELSSTILALKQGSNSLLEKISSLSPDKLLFPRGQAKWGLQPTK